MDIMRHKKALFAASSVMSYGIGQSETAQAALCSCLPTSNLVKIDGSAFKFLGSATYGFDASLHSDSVYTLNVDSGPSGYVDFKTGSGTGGAWATVCRISYMNNAASCSGSSVNQYTNLTGNTNYDKFVDFTGAISSSFSSYDYHKINLAGSNSGLAMTGAAYGPTACWD